VTVDASVFLNGFISTEVGHALSRALLARLQELATPIVVPTLVLPEVSAAISRVRGRADLARAFAAALKQRPHVTFVALDTLLAQQAADIAAQHRVRGSDAVYAAVAVRYASRLISLDNEQRNRLRGMLDGLTPAEALAEIRPDEPPLDQL
jgi:predicted nucleic acid-binding protein